MNPIPQAAPQVAPGFVTWNVNDETGRSVAIEVASRAYGAAQSMTINRSYGTTTGYRDVGGSGVSVREAVTRSDYDFFRPGERLPTTDREIMWACMQAYEKFPIVQNMVNLMSDFACKGIDIVHPRAKVEKFGREWANKVGLAERSERMLSMLFRSGNVIVRRQTSKLADRTLDVLRSQGADKIVKTKVNLPSGEIPLAYTVLDPRWVEVIGGELVPFIGTKALQYGVRIPPHLVKRLKNPNGIDTNLLSMVPVSVMQSATSAGSIVPLPQNKTATIFYKKDDFQIWAKPLLYPLLDHLKLYDKMMMADRAALDGAISQIRLWKLGSLEHRIFPTEASIARLADMLLNNVGGGVMDLIWGPDLTLDQVSSEAYNFLGQEKYVPVLQSIFQGLGVPPSMTGMSAEGSFTSSFMGLKVLVERLEYGRMLIAKFWENELEIVRSRFGFREPFTITFDQASLSDEAAMLKLLIDMADRNMLSDEFVQERFGAVPEIEKVRLQREGKQRKTGRMPAKASPFHVDSQQSAMNERAFVNQGHLTPDQVGLDHPPAKSGSKTPFELASEEKLKQAANKAALKPKKAKKSDGGRPVGAVDTAKRKQKRVLPRTKAAEMAAAMMWANEAQDKVEEHTKSEFLAAKKCKNLRQLTSAQAEEYEGFKFALLCKFNIGDRVTKGTVKAALKDGELTMPNAVAELQRVTVARYVEREGHQPTQEKVRQIQAAVYALYKTDLGDTADVLTEIEND